MKKRVTKTERTKRGFGTNFHDVYKKQSGLYHDFSKAEVFDAKLNKRLSELYTGKVAIDIACGTGHKTNMLTKHFDTVYGLDFSKTLLEKARDIYGKNKQIHFVHASAKNIPLLDESVDTVFISWGSFPLTETLKEIERILKPGGIAIRIGAWGKDEFTSLFPKFDLKRIKRIQKQFEKAGYKHEQHLVHITFDSVAKAQKVMSKIVGVKEKDITKNVFEHEVILNYYKKHI